MKKACFLLAMMALLMLSSNTAYAFKPEPFEQIASPLSLFIADSELVDFGESNITNLIVEEYKANISVLESSAEVDTLIKIRHIGNTSDNFFLALNINNNLKLSNKSIVFLNGDLFNGSQIGYKFNPNEELIIKAYYEVPTNYTSEHFKGNFFVVYNPILTQFPEGRVLNKSINVCEINVKFPDDFGASSDNVDTEKKIINGTYNSITESSCPYLFIFKYKSSAQSVSFGKMNYDLEPPLMLPYLHPLVLIEILIAIIIGLSIIYFVKNKKLK